MEVCPPVRLAVRWPSANGRPTWRIARRTAVFPYVAVRQLDRTADGWRSVPTAVRPEPSAWPSAPAIGYGRPPAVRLGRPHSGRPPPSARPSARLSTTRTASSLIPAPGSPPPPLPMVPSTVEFQVEYKEGSTNTLNLLPNLCFPRALSCTMHLLLGKPLLRKSEIVLGVSFGTPNTISAAWLLHSFIQYFCPHHNGQQTMVPLVR